MKISIIGMGQVGATLAYTLLLRELADEMVLVDRNNRIAEGEALDLEHAEAFTSHPVIVRPGQINETGDSDIIVLCCSVPWNQQYKSRFEIGRDNLKIFRQIVPDLAKASPQAKLLVITNPVDVMTYHAINLSGFGPNRVFGTGTLIDSARFRTMLSKKMKIHPDDLRAYVLGEHGDSQFPVFSMAVAGGTRIVENDATMEIFHKTMRAGFDVASLKGHTSYAISMAAILVIEAMAWDTHRTMPLSILIEGFQGIKDVCLSLPVVVGKSGVAQVLEPVLGPEEKDNFARCATIVQDAIKLSLS